MKKTDIHVLNWEKITQNTSEQSNNKTVNKGILFEDLIEKLLTAMFPKEIWRRTIESHDGKRDFVYPYEENLPDQKWAECKNYSSNLSLNIIAPTLIMGTIENIQSIFFFSYSPLNDNAIEGLLRYSKTSKRYVKVFDGNVLESLICKYHDLNGIADFFPNTDFKKAYSVLTNKGMRIIKMFKDMNGNKFSPLHLFELGESFYINIIIQNLTHEQGNYEVSVKNNRENLLKCDMSGRYFTLPFAEIGEYSIQCQTLSPGNVNCKIEINVQDTKKTFKVETKIKIIDEPYLFWTGEYALNVLNQCEQYLTSYNKLPMLIVAESGMGKSTLINILSQEKNVYEKYKLLKIDLNLTRNCCIKNLFSLLVGLNENDETPKDQTIDDNKALSFLIGNYAANAEMISETIMKFYDKYHPYLFVIDDVQKIDRAYLTLFRELNERSVKEDKPIYYILALDEDKCSVDTLFSRLNWNIKKKDKCKIVSLKKYKKNDIISFLKHKFGLEKIDKYFENFDVEIRPLEMHNLCSNLKSERIIACAPESKVYQIIDAFKFEEKIRQIHYADISLENICESLEKGDTPEYILKYLYLTDKINYNSRKTYDDIINELISFGILKEEDGLIIFYHDELRNQVGEKFVFSEEDYADIYADDSTDAIAKSLCALNQIGRIQDSASFLKSFFHFNYEIQKRYHRFEICGLIFEHLNQLTEQGLTTDALYFVKKNFALLNVEQGHSVFFGFLKSIVDSALISNWDIDDESVENMAYFIKKFFDRSLSTYNYQHCSEYFEKFEKIFYRIKHISNARRYFWLSHYANRAAIALDRTSIPLSKEPDNISKMYAQSEKYCKDAGSDNELLLQIVVDNFNRHYIYRHSLTLDIVQKTYECLLKISQTFSEESMLLDYHLLLLEYLTFKMSDELKSESDYLELMMRVTDTRKKCQSSFFSLKLYLLEIYILIYLGRFSDADTILNQAFEFVHKKEMRSYIYKLTYIKAHILIFQNNSSTESASYQQMFLAFEQMIEQRKDAPNDLMREIFLVVELVRSIEKHGFSFIQMIPISLCDENKYLLDEICKYIRGEYVVKKDLYDMPSYFVFNDISFPNI